MSVTPAAASKIAFSTFPNPIAAGASQSVLLTAADAYGNVAAGYAGTVQFTSSDAGAGLPANYTFTSADQGQHTFTVALNTAGTQSFTATDTVTPGLTATQSNIAVDAAQSGAAATLQVSGVPVTDTAGTPLSVKVTAVAGQRQRRHGLHRHRAILDGNLAGRAAGQLHIHRGRRRRAYVY